jgi:hypothetical protein
VNQRQTTFKGFKRGLSPIAKAGTITDLQTRGIIG